MSALMWVKGTPLSGLVRSDRRSVSPRGLYDPHGCCEHTGKRVSSYTITGTRPWTREAQLCVCVCVCLRMCVFTWTKPAHAVKTPTLPVPAFEEIPGLVLLTALTVYFIFKKQTQCALKDLASRLCKVWSIKYWIHQIKWFNINMCVFLVGWTNCATPWQPYERP